MGKATCLLLKKEQGADTDFSCNQSSLDADFFTMPVKYRPMLPSFPNQLNTNINGSLYFGFRNDKYHLSYREKPITGSVRRIAHYGLSFGIFTGLGSTAMNPWVTDNKISSEYDGVVWNKGIAGIVGIDNMTIGLALGWDNLLDKNKGYWIYEGKGFIGLVFGININ